MDRRVWKLDVVSSFRAGLGGKGYIGRVGLGLGILVLLGFGLLCRRCYFSLF